MPPTSISHRLVEPVRLLDFLKAPVDGPHSGSAEQTAGFKSRLFRNQSELVISANHRACVVRKWKGFNYPVLRVALRDRLERRIGAHQILENHGPDCNGGDEASSHCVDFGYELLIDRIRVALDGEHWAIIRSNKSKGSDHVELPRESEYMESKAKENSDRCRILHLGNCWEFSHCAQSLVLGLVMSCEELPLALLGSSGGQDRCPTDDSIGQALCEIETACRTRQTRHAFIFTSEGAVLLKFQTTGASKNATTHQQWQDPRVQPQSSLEVLYAVSTWAPGPRDILQMPLPMAVWALCSIALADKYQDCHGEKFTTNLNSWTAMQEAGRKMYRHSWLPQESRGHPPGARVLPCHAPSETTIMHSTSSFSTMRDISIPKFSFVEWFVETLTWHWSTEGKDGEELSTSNETASQRIDTLDCASLRERSENDRLGRWTFEPVNIQTQQPDPPPLETMEASRLSSPPQPKKRKLTNNVTSQEYQQRSVTSDMTAFEPWSSRLRPRKKRPNYRA